MDDTAALRERLIRDDENFKRLQARHREYEERLEVLQRRRFLSDEEQLEEARLKKMKLKVKDEMEMVVRQHVEGVGKSG